VRPGNFSFSNIAPGAYSVQITPPNQTFSRLNSLNIQLPQAGPISFVLNAPTPGRSFLTGTLTGQNNVSLDYSTTSISIGGFGARTDNSGYFKVMPTAGTSGTYTITSHDNLGASTFKMVGSTNTTINQDTILNLPIPTFYQRIRVVNSRGVPIAGVSVTAGLSQATPYLNGPMKPIEGMGDFTGSWNSRGIVTDKMDTQIFLRYRLRLQALVK